jgi:SAM-dependent methyltransferase
MQGDEAYVDGMARVRHRPWQVHRQPKFVTTLTLGTVPPSGLSVALSRAPTDHGLGESSTMGLRDYLTADPVRKEKIKSILRRIGYDPTHWLRVVMYRTCFEFVRSLGPENLEVLEIGPGPTWQKAFNFKSYTPTQYPDFDICSHTLDRQFDLIIADQVLEHVEWPYRAGRNVFAMLRSGGYFVVTTPFLIRIHWGPQDCSRWTEIGLGHLLQECGFEADRVTTGSWGNRACVKANLNRWPMYGYGWLRPLVNEPAFPLQVWAFAQKA